MQLGEPSHLNIIYTRINAIGITK